MGPRISEQQLMRDDRYEILASTFVRWANTISAETVYELADIVKFRFLSVFTSLVSGKTFANGNSRSEDICNAFQLLDDGDRFSQINVLDLVDGNLKALCSVAWQFVQLFWKRFAPEETRDLKLSEVLKDWCLEKTKKFEEVQINDFTSSWRDGYSLNALLASYNPKLIVMDEVREMRGDERLEHAMGVAERHYGVPRLLLPKDFNSEHLDMKCVVCYLMMIYLSMASKKAKSLRRRSAPQPTTGSITKTDSQESKASGSQSTGHSQKTTSQESLRRHSQQSENMDARSRKSSSSSQRSGRKGRKCLEEIVTDYESCLEQVLAWLLEAEERASTMEPVEEKDVELVKIQFREHEHFMQSLTESQDSVGRVLHRGQILCQKLEEKQSSVILSQLLMVNARWERVRENAMSRQNLLQQRLNFLQTQQLEEIRRWLNNMEEEMEHAEPLTPDVAATENLIRAHATIQEKIEKEQEAVKTLSNFVAVVDENDASVSYENLEKLLHSVGERWMAVCEWAELRAHHLDEFFQLISQYKMIYKNLLVWLDEREKALKMLKAVDDLKSDFDVVEQVESLQHMEAALEAGHADFVSLSQLAVDVLAKLDSVNSAATETMRNEVDNITERWDYIVSRIEEHSQLLVNCGKAETRQLLRGSSAAECEAIEDDGKAGETCTAAGDVGEGVGNDAEKLLIESSAEHVKDEDGLVASCSNLPCTSVISPVEIFIGNLKHVSADLQPLIEWASSFTAFTERDEIRDVIQICQEKLREIKLKESQVNSLHSELERIRNLDVGAEQLQLANDSFEEFTLKWSQIVAKISDSLNSLSYRGEVKNEDGFDAETLRIANQLEEFFDSSANILHGCTQIPSSERVIRLQKLNDQITAQEKNVAFLESNMPDETRVNALKKRMGEISGQITELIRTSNFVERFENFLKSRVLPSADIEGLRNELQQCEALLSGLAEFKSQEGKYEELEKRGIAKRDRISNLLDKCEKFEAKIKTVESTFQELQGCFSALKNERLKLPQMIKKYQKLAVDGSNARVKLKDVEDCAKEMATVILYEDVEGREAILNSLRNRVQQDINLFQSLEDEIQETISLLIKESKCACQVSIRSCRDVVAKLTQAITSSFEASDAEEFSEHLDVLEKRCNEVKAALDNTLSECTSSATLSEEVVELKKDVDAVTDKAKNRIDELNIAIQEWERFETLLANFRDWHKDVQVILSCRALDDIAALDVPDEYKRLQSEFDHYEDEIKALKDLVKTNATILSSSNRFQLQLDHLTQQFETLTGKFNSYKQPISLENKIERFLREICEMDSNIDELSKISEDTCHGALDHAKQIAVQLSESKTVLQELENAKNLLLQDRILTVSCGEELDEKIEKSFQKLTHSAASLERLSQCVLLVDRLRDELRKLDKVVNDVESQLNTFTQSDNLDNADVDRSVLETLQNELNRNELLLISAEETAEKLRKESVQFDQDMIEERRRRIRRIRGVLRSWLDVVKGLSEDSASNLAQFDTAYSNFKKVLEEMEKLDDSHLLIDEMEKNRTEKSLLLEKYRRLIKTNTEVESRFSLPLCQIEDRWNSLEKKCQKARLAPSINSPQSLPNVPIDGTFEENIYSLQKIFEVAKEYVDFNKYPVSSVPDWAKRIQDVSNWLLEYGDQMKAVLEEGRRLASRGRMELDVHDALGSLDDVVDLANEVEMTVKSNNALLIPLQTKAETLSREMRVMKEVLDQLAARDLSEPAIANATQRDLLDRQSQLEQLHRKSEDLHRCLPGTSSDLVNKEIDEIYEQVRLIEKEIGVSIKKITNGREFLSGYASSGPSFEDRSVGPDTVSVSSAGAPSLALEVQETDDEKAKTDSIQLNSSVPPEIKIEHADSMAAAYVELDRIEERLSADDAFPFENLSGKQTILKAMKITLDRIEKTVNDSQMTMDLVESEAAKEKISLLRSALLKQQREVEKLLSIWEELESNLKASDSMINKINVVLSDLEGRNKSPDLDELESMTVLLDDRLQQAYAQVQHTSLKAEPIISQLGERQASLIENKLRRLGENWKKCEGKVNEKRRALDERLADRSELINEIELLEFWCDETETECSSTVNLLNRDAATEFRARIDDRIAEYDSKFESLRKIKALKERFVSSNLPDPSVKQKMQCVVAELGKRIKNLKEEMDNRKVALEKVVKDATTFQTDIATVLSFCDRAERAVEIIQETKLVVPSGADLDYVRMKQDQIEALVSSIERRWKTAISKDSSIDEHQNMVVDDLLKKWEHAKERIASVANVPTLAHDSSFSESPPRDEKCVESKVSSSSIPEEISEQGCIEYGSLKESVVEPEESKYKAMSGKEQALLNAAVQLRHWLSETERDATVSVDIINLQSIRDAAHKMQSFIDQLKIRHLELLHILNESQDQVVRSRAELTLGEWDRFLTECKRRKTVLNEMVGESRAWDKLRYTVQVWLTESQQRLNEGGKTSELNEEALRNELSELKRMDEKFNEMKGKMAELNARSNSLLDAYRLDEGHNLSHATSRINNLWSKFNDNLRIRRAVLEAALRSRSDFQSALTQLEQWMEKTRLGLLQLDKSSCNLQLLKDSLKRKEWIDMEKCFQLEMDAHEDLVNSVGEMGTQLVRSAEDSTERERLIERLASVNDSWREMRKLDDSIRERLVNAQEEWEKLISQLGDNLFWVESKTKALVDEQPIGKTFVSVQKQHEFFKQLERDVEERQHEIDDCVTLAHSYLMQHDLRPKIHTINALCNTSEPSDEEEAELRRIGLQINTDCEDLVNKWAGLKKQVRSWSRVVDDAYAKMEQLSSALAECQLALSNMESVLEKLTPVEQLRLEQLVSAMKESELLKETLARTRIHIDDANDWCGQLLASNVDLDPEPSALLKSVNDRFAKVKVDIRVRIAALEHALADFGPCSQHFLMNSVRPPWQRAVSTLNHLPYYINHETEITQWVHPVMVEILLQLSKFNQVKFSAYRTAMKLRAIQKRLCLDLLSLQELDSQLQSLSAIGGDQLLPIKDAIMCLVPLFESAHKKFSQLVCSVPLAVDLFLNFVLDVYDPGRDGILRTFSFKVALVLLCSASLEDKYRYLYQMVSTGEGLDQKSLALLLYDLIHIPKFFGEAAAFGGSNVEPSVRSCFEMVKFARTVNIDDFLLWLKKEPQTIVWLPVMHRLTSAEFAKHQAKCNVCKMYPITGLRYRCLRCFNFDICQNCFFSQRVAKNHKLSHPMQEYCVPTTSGEDMRDFGLIVKNKFRSTSKKRIGYLPVQTVDEGIPLETNNITPTNLLTEHLHNRMQTCAQRLWRANGDTPPPLPENTEELGVADIKSPLQLLSQVEQMHKEELHQVLHKLQYENRELKKEIERRKNFEGIGSTPNLSHSFPRNVNSSIAGGRSVPSLSQSTDDHLIREARLLRQHKERLEERSRILEEQNKQLEVQLERLRTVISKQQNLGVDDLKLSSEDHEMSVVSGDDGEGTDYETRPNRMPSLIASVDQLGRAMQSLVTSMVSSDKNEEIMKENGAQEDE